MFLNAGLPVSTTFYGGDYARFEIDIVLDKTISVSSRTRYSCWDLLGDVGGFNDGLILLCSFIVSPYVAYTFTSELLSSYDVEKDTTSRSRSDLNSRPA